MSQQVQPVLGILAGSGNLPQMLVKSCQASGREFFVLAFEESNHAHRFESVPHATVRLGAVGDALSYLRSANVQEVVLAGAIKRPALSSLKPDMAAAKLLKKIGGAFFSGDDALLRALIAFLEEEKFRVIGAEDIIGGLLMPAGVVTKIKPSAGDEADIALGLRAAKKLGALDIGQAVIVQQGCVLGVEAAEGTAALIARCAALRREGKGGVLVKAKKPQQETRADLPAIGTETLQQLFDGGFAGVACEAESVLILDRDAVITTANHLGLFVAGVSA